MCKVTCGGCARRDYSASMPVIYVAGPYRAKSREGVELNIQAAKHVGLQTVRKGWSPLIPHANTAHLDAICPELDDQYWLDATLALMRRCDAVVLVPGWEHSSGTAGEIAEAQRLGIPVFHSEHVLPHAIDFEVDRANRIAQKEGAACSA